MKKKIAFIAIGQAGGNIGQLFEERGFSVLYLNTSEEDLSTLSGAKYKYHITGGEGCNKDRKKAKQLVIDDYDQIAAEMDAKLDAEIIFVVFARKSQTTVCETKMMQFPLQRKLGVFLLDHIRDCSGARHAFLDYRNRHIRLYNAGCKICFLAGLTLVFLPVIIPNRNLCRNNM